MDPSELTLDGNALAGPLSELFAVEATVARGTCSACGAVGPLAETLVYGQAPGLVVRCRSCGEVLIVMVEAGERRWIEFDRLRRLEIRA
jgi:hypothetical protein